MKRVALVGIDGVGLSEYNSIFTSRLFSKVNRSRSAVGTLWTIPPYTPPMWTSILTGVNPGKHGVSDFLDYRTGTVRTSWNVHYPRIWEILSMNKLRTLVFNAPLTYPFDSMYLRETIIISGWDSPEIAIYPKSVHDKFKYFFPQFKHEWHKLCRRNKDEHDIYLRVLTNELKKRIEGLKEIIEKYEPDTLIAIFSETDWVNHVRAIIDSAVYRKYMVKLAEIISDFISFVRRSYFDAVIIASDHDFMEYELEFNIGNLMFKYFPSMIEIDIDADRESGVFFLRDIGNVVGKHVRGRFLKILNSSFTKRVIIPNTWLRRILVSGPLRIMGSKLVLKASGVYGAHLPAIQGLYLDHENPIARHILRILSSLGFRMRRREEVFWGPYLKELPDIIFMDETFLTKVRLKFSLEFRKEEKVISDVVIYDHAPYGMIIAIGDDIVPGNLGKVKPWDVVPTILAYMGVAIPHDTDGRVIREMMALETQEKKEKYMHRWLTMRRIKASRAAWI